MFEGFHRCATRLSCFRVEDESKSVLLRIALLQLRATTWWNLHCEFRLVVVPKESEPHTSALGAVHIGEDVATRRVIAFLLIS